MNNLAYETVGCAIEAHKQIGPGLPVSVYKTCLGEEFSNNVRTVQQQVSVPIICKGKDTGSRLIHDLKAQLLSYLKLTGKPKGLPINFQSEKIIDHLTLLITNEFAKLPESWW
jgi:hypothetical protein